MSAPAQTIGLCMIVRDEAEILPRCLRSVRDLIDTWVICDTGSVDGTADVIRAELEGVQGTLHHAAWVDFAHNRSELLRHARGTADYLLLLDADMTLLVRAELPELVADAYLLREVGPLDFAVPRLVRGDRAWWYEGSTHEYLATDGLVTHASLDALLIEHHGDGAARWEKLVRDVGLLKRDLLHRPGNPRSIFYLAQTYRDLGRQELAIETYLRRVELGGWSEEVFYANLQAGILLAERDLERAVPVLLHAWERRPTRAEPFYELARAYRARGLWQLAHMFATRGIEIPYPDDIHFVHRWVYDWGLLLERALAAAGLGAVEQSRGDLRRLLREPDLPRDIEELAARTLADLAGTRQGAELPGEAASAPRLQALVSGVRVGEIKLDVRPAWPCFNPSIAASGGGFRMVVRTANYRIARGVLHEDGVLHTINYLVELDHALAVTSIEPIVDRAPRPDRYPSPILGFEDCRLFEVDGRWHATATTCEFNQLARREMALLELDGAEIVSARPLPSPGAARHEKNWMPFMVDDALHLVYTVAPTVVLRYDPATGGTEIVAESAAPGWMENLRGGSQGVALEEGLLFVVHGLDPHSRARRYLHRFVLLDDRLRVAGCSEPFTFVGDEVEFCAGMARSGDELVLSFGVRDAAAGLAVVPLHGVLALLEPSSGRQDTVTRWDVAATDATEEVVGDRQTA